MLVLTRRSGEAIVIGQDIEVRVLSVDRQGKVRLGLTAPEEVLILREELVRESEEVECGR